MIFRCEISEENEKRDTEFSFDFFKHSFTHLVKSKTKFKGKENTSQEEGGGM